MNYEEDEDLREDFYEATVRLRVPFPIEVVREVATKYPFLDPSDALNSFLKSDTQTILSVLIKDFDAEVEIALPVEQHDRLGRVQDQVVVKLEAKDALNWVLDQVTGSTEAIDKALNRIRELFTKKKISGGDINIVPGIGGVAISKDTYEEVDEAFRSEAKDIEETILTILGKEVLTSSLLITRVMDTTDFSRNRTRDAISRLVGYKTIIADDNWFFHVANDYNPTIAADAEGNAVLLDDDGICDCKDCGCRD